MTIDVRCGCVSTFQPWQRMILNKTPFFYVFFWGVGGGGVSTMLVASYRYPYMKPDKSDQKSAPRVAEIADLVSTYIAYYS